jgi:hypothetical protein
VTKTTLTREELLEAVTAGPRVLGVAGGSLLNRRKAAQLLAEAARRGPGGQGMGEFLHPPVSHGDLVDSDAFWELVDQAMVSARPEKLRPKLCRIIHSVLRNNLEIQSNLRGPGGQVARHLKFEDPIVQAVLAAAAQGLRVGNLRKGTVPSTFAEIFTAPHLVSIGRFKAAQAGLAKKPGGRLLLEAHLFHLGNALANMARDQRMDWLCKCAGAEIVEELNDEPLCAEQLERFFTYSERCLQEVPWHLLPFDTVYYGLGAGATEDKLGRDDISEIIDVKLQALRIDGIVATRAGLVYLAGRGSKVGSDTDFALLARIAANGHTRTMVGGGLDVLAIGTRMIWEQRSIAIEQPNPRRTALKRRPKKKPKKPKHRGRAPKPYYIIEMTRRSKIEAMEKELAETGSAAGSLAWRIAVRRHERVRVQRGRLPIGETHEEKLVARKYRIYKGGGVQAQDMSRLYERQIQSPAPHEWLAVLVSVVKEYERGPKDAEFVPSCRRIKGE